MVGPYIVAGLFSVVWIGGCIYIGYMLGKARNQ